MVGAAAYIVKVRIKLTQSNWAGAGTELGKTSGVLKGGASGANRGYVLAHCAPLTG